MQPRNHSRSIFAAAGLFLLVAPAALAAPSVTWEDWQEDLFARAQQENRFVILDLEAVWCHWCHVMEEETYQDPAVVELLRSRYITIRVDQDSAPDLSARYGRWGWPATIIFAPDGTEIVKRRGFVPPPMMASLLQAVIDDPSPGPSVVPEAPVTPAESWELSAEQRQRLLDRYHELYDPDNGSWGTFHKFANPPALDFAMEHSLEDDPLYTLMARQTLRIGLHLLDPEWGGVYQYSDRVDWLSPHYEKIMYYQAENLRLYSRAYARWQHGDHLSAALAIHRYMAGFLPGDEGAFYTSQDADLSYEIPGDDYFTLSAEQRAELGIPRIDENIYARENGWAIRAFAALYDATGLEDALHQAVAAAEYVMAHRRLPGGGYAHGAADPAGPYLSDSQSMAHAFLALHRSTGERHWLDEAMAALDFVETMFRVEDGGYFSAHGDPRAAGVFRDAVFQVEEMDALARTASLVHHYTGDPRFRAMAEHAMRYLAAPGVVDEFFFLPGVLLADRHINRDPVHIIVVGSKQDPASAALHQAARRYPAEYLRLDWWDKSEGPLPNADVTYPTLDRAAAFACADGACSLPVFDGEGIVEAVDRLVSAPQVRQGFTAQSMP